MKKFLTLALILGASVVFVPSIQAKSGSAPALNNLAEPQINIRIGPQRNRRARTVTQTRTVRRGRAVYRETYRITYLPNGRTRTQLISRVRIR